MLAVSESCLVPTLSSGNAVIDGFKLYRNDSVGKPKEGVAVYLRGEFFVAELEASVLIENHTEYLFLDVRAPGRNICYRRFPVALPKQISKSHSAWGMLAHLIPVK